MARGKQGGTTTRARRARAPKMSPVEKECARLDALAARLRKDADDAAASIDTLRSHADAAEQAAKTLREGTS